MSQSSSANPPLLFDPELERVCEFAIQIDIEFVIAGGVGIVVRESEVDSTRIFRVLDLLWRKLDLLFKNLFVSQLARINGSPNACDFCSFERLAQLNEHTKGIGRLKAFYRLQVFAGV